MIDDIVNFCDQMYKQQKQQIDEYVCDECNHPEKCESTCSTCLEQVHWYPKYGGRCDYDCDHLLYYYTCKYSHKYCSEIIYSLGEINLEEYPCYNILSLGCGATPDLMAFNYVNPTGKKQIQYRGYDRNPRWENIHNEIENYTSKYNHMDVKCKREDVFDVFNEGAQPGYNVLIMQYFLSHLYNTNQNSEINKLYDEIIQNVLAHRYSDEDSPFLIIINDIDSNRKGRDYFWPLQTKIVNAGYQTNAIAKCFKHNLYLERSTQYHSDDNKFVIDKDIKSSYDCAINCSSAQLIIEVR